MIITEQQFMNLVRNITQSKAKDSFKRYFGCSVINLDDHKRELVFKSPEHETMFMLKYSQAMNYNILDELYVELVAAANALEKANKT